MGDLQLFKELFVNFFDIFDVILALLKRLYNISFLRKFSIIEFKNVKIFGEFDYKS